MSLVSARLIVGRKSAGLKNSRHHFPIRSPARSALGLRIGYKHSGGAPLSFPSSTAGKGEMQSHTQSHIYMLLILSVSNIRFGPIIHSVCVLFLSSNCLKYLPISPIFIPLSSSRKLSGFSRFLSPSDSQIELVEKIPAKGQLDREVTSLVFLICGVRWKYTFTCHGIFFAGFDALMLDDS